MTRIPLAVNRTIVGVAALAVFAAGCGEIAERATEEAVERAVEAEGGGDVDIDFNEDGVSIESDEGDFTLRADDGGVEIEGTDRDGNEFSANADEGGLEANSEDGASLDVDSDGSFTARDADGEVARGDVSVDEGELDFTIEGEDGDTAFSSGEGIPDQWPGDVPEPEGLDEVIGTYTSESGGPENVAVTGTTEQNARDAVDTYGKRLVDAGFEATSSTDQGEEFVNATYERDEQIVTITAVQTGDRTDVVIAIVNG